MSIRACTLAIHLHHVYSSTNAHFLPPSPQIKPEPLSPTSVVAIGAPTAPPPPCPFELECSPSASTMSIRVQTLVSHFHRVHSSPNARLHLSSSARHHHVYSSANTCFPPPSPQIEPERSSPTSVMSIGAQTPPTSTVSIQAQTLAICLHHVYSSANAHLPPPPARMLAICFHHVYSSANAHLPPPPARTLAIRCHHVYSSTNARLPPPPCLFEPKRSSSISTTSIRAQSLVSCFFYHHRIFFSVFWIVFEAQFVWVNLSTYMLILLI